MIVSPNQNINTLIRLRKGLLLCSKDKSRKKLIVPHGEVYMSEEGVDIDIKSLKEPPYFSYDLDFCLKRLVASESKTAWLYLACLHAYTAQLLPDEFTGLTGTEMALDILQSGFSWSCIPYEANDLEIIENLAKLSPIRVFYPAHLKEMQNVSWPKGVSSQAAHEGFRYIADKLINDSERIKMAFKSDNVRSKSSLLLASRAYHRHKHMYTPSGWLSPGFEGVLEHEECKIIKINHFKDENMGKIEKCRLISKRNYLKYMKNLKNPNCIIDYFYKRECKSLNGAIEEFNLSISLAGWLEIAENFNVYWLSLAEYAARVKVIEERICFEMFISFCAYTSDVPLELLVVLKQIVEGNEAFKSLKMPEYKTFMDYDKFEYEKSTILRILSESFIEFNEYKKKNLNFSICDLNLKYNAEKIKAINELESYYSINYKDSLEKPELIDGLNIEFFKPMFEDVIQSCFAEWRANRELHGYFIELNKIFNKFFYTQPKNESLTLQKLNKKNFCLSQSKQIMNKTVEFNWKCRVMDEKKEELFEKAKLIYESGWLEEAEIIEYSRLSMKKRKFPFSFDQESDLAADYLKDLRKSWKTYLKLEHKKFFIPRKEKLETEKSKIDWALDELMPLFDLLFKPRSELDVALENADLWPRLVPIKILKYLINAVEAQIKYDKRHKQVIGALGVFFSLKQRVMRCLNLKKAGKIRLNEIRKELANRPHENWSPKKRPDWLLFEIESNLSIRPVQVKVAKLMIKGKCGKNACMQLNMGEGKTSVITPLVISSLANKDCLVRVIVLASLLNVNYSSLVQKLGGLLNKRVYILPCDRDINFNNELIEAYMSVYEECKLNKGVVLTLPEYCLSFKLKGLEICGMKGNETLARSLLNAQKWLEDNSRDILDESDEILNVMYQLVYSSGQSSIVNGGQVRWEFAEEILLMAKKYFRCIKEKFGEKSVELSEVKRSLSLF